MLVQACLCLLKIPFLLPPLMLRPTPDMVLADDVDVDLRLLIRQESVGRHDGLD